MMIFCVCLDVVLKGGPPARLADGQDIVGADVGDEPDAVAVSLRVQDIFNGVEIVADAFVDGGLRSQDRLERVCVVFVG